jgi:predicted phage terminase large subunit-like protein
MEWTMNQQLITPDSPMKSFISSRRSWNEPRFQLEAVKTEKAKRNLKEFVKQAWPVLEPSTQFVEGIHIDAICSHLQAVTEGRIAHLIINVPPGHAKSLLTGVFWPVWVWIRSPESRWLFSSYREPLAVRDSLKCRRLIESDWYQQRWSSRFQLREDQNQKQRFENDRTGYRVVVPMSAGTGERGDYVVVDDPHSVDQAASDAERTAAVDWWNGSMSTRLNDPSKGHKIVIQQRLHEADLTGDLLIRGGYEHLCLPAEFEADRRCCTSIGWKDPRSAAGELLWPQRIDEAALNTLKATLGCYRYAGQFQQRPAPADGGMLKRHWWRYWQPRGANLPPVVVRLPDGTIERRNAVELPSQFDETIQSWDMAFKDTKNSDFVVGQVHAAHGADRYLLDQVRDRLDLPGTLLAVRRLSGHWPNAQLKLVEDKANGPAVIQSLRHEIGGLVEVNPEGGKMSRAAAASPQLESGNWYLPHPMLKLWVDEFVAECAAFPAGANDDQVDAWSQGAKRLLHHRSAVVQPTYPSPRRVYGQYSWMA